MSEELKIVVNNAKRILTIEEMMAADDIEFAEVEVFGGIVRLGSVNAGDMIEFVEDNKDRIKKRDAGLRILISSLVDGEGNRIGNVDTDLPRWKKRSQKTCQKIVEAVLKLNGLGDATKKRDAIVAAILALGEVTKESVTAAVDAALEDKADAQGNA